MSVSDRDARVRTDGEPAAPLLNLTTHQLQYLEAVSRSDSLGAAARRLRISQSALSQGLSELERRVGVTLFERQGRKRVLTDRGREMVAHGDRILAATRDLTIWASAATTGRSGRVRLGLIDIAAVNYFPDTLIDFRNDRPDVELRLRVAPSAALVGQLIEGRLDAAVIVEPPAPAPGTEPAGRSGPAPARHPDLELIELLNEDLAIYAPTGGGRLGLGSTTPGPAGTTMPPSPPPMMTVGRPSTWGPWVTFPPESHTRRHIAAALRELGAEFRVEAESNQPEVLRQMVHLGLGWTVLPVLQAEAEPNPLIRARRKPLLTRRLVVAARRGSTLDPATAELIARLRRRAAAIAND